MRRICRGSGLSAPRFYREFGSLESFCEKGGIKLDKETLKRMKETARATRRHVKKSVKKAVATRVAKPTPESENSEQQTPTFELMQEDLVTEREARESRRERTQQFASEIKTLALNDDPEISGPIVDALCFEVLPTVLEKEFGVSFTLEDLCQAELTLRKVQKEQKRLHAKKIQLDGYAKKVQADREKLKADSDKGVLFQRVESLEAEKRVLTSQVNEARIVYENYRRVFSGFWATVFKCKDCSTRFLGYMESYPEANAWLLKGDWRKEKLKFLNSSLGHQT